jgi:hypothetical protein
VRWLHLIAVGLLFAATLIFCGANFEMIAKSFGLR